MQEGDIARCPNPLDLTITWMALIDQVHPNACSVIWMEHLAWSGGPVEMGYVKKERLTLYCPETEI